MSFAGNNAHFTIPYLIGLDGVLSKINLSMTQLTDSLEGYGVSEGRKTGSAKGNKL